MGQLSSPLFQIGGFAVPAPLSGGSGLTVTVRAPGSDRGRVEVPVEPVPVTPEAVRIMVLPNGMVDRRNAAKALGRTSKTLCDWKRLGIGPKSHRIAGRSFYRWSDIEEFMRADKAA